MSAANTGRAVERALALLARPGAWLAEAGEGYAVRLDGDGRRRPALRLDEAAFRRLIEGPGLAVRPSGGWRLPRNARRPAEEVEHRSSPIGALLTVKIAGGVARREGALAWLARRKGPDGRPWLSPAELAAGEKLRDDFERAGVQGRLTMAWDAGPRSKGGRGPGVDPLEHGRSARARVRAALEAVGPELRRPLEQVCLRGEGLGGMETALGLQRRTGKTLLKQALGRLAAHYRLG